RNDLRQRPAPVVVVERDAQERVANRVGVVAAREHLGGLFVRNRCELFVVPHGASPFSTEARAERRTPSFSSPFGRGGPPGGEPVKRNDNCARGDRKRRTA